MLYTHHTTHAGRAAARAAGVVVPLLSPYRAAHAAADAVYAAQNTCLTGHDDRTDSGCHDLPCWPEEVQWNGTGHGKYPFWVGANGCSKSPAAIQTSWSQTKQSEKFVHSSCDLSTVGGPASGPCTHLFVEWGAWMYTPDESFCCISGCGNTPSARAAPANSSSLLFPPASCSSGNAQPLTAPQSDFMKTFTYNGVSDNYVGTYYSGKVKNYTMGALSTRPFIGAFWYFTDLDDNPIEQGEGPQVWPRDICNQGASYVYHEYGQFAKASLDASVFDVPAVCKTTTTTCMFP